MTVEGIAGPPCPGSVAERRARFEFGGATGSDAEVMALADAGFETWADLTAAWREYVAAQLDRLPVQGRDGVNLAKVTRAFVASPWYVQAVRHGWTMPELFGTSASGEPVGLVLRLIRASDGSRLQLLDLSSATIVLPNGSTRRFRRFGPEFDSAAPWWMQPASDERKNQLEAA